MKRLLYLILCLSLFSCSDEKKHHHSESIPIDSNQHAINPTNSPSKPIIQSGTTNTVKPIAPSQPQKPYYQNNNIKDIGNNQFIVTGITNSNPPGLIKGVLETASTKWFTIEGIEFSLLTNQIPKGFELHLQFTGVIEVVISQSPPRKDANEHICFIGDENNFKKIGTITSDLTKVSLKTNNIRYNGDVDCTQVSSAANSIRTYPLTDLSAWYISTADQSGHNYVQVFSHSAPVVKVFDKLGQEVADLSDKVGIIVDLKIEFR